MLVNGPYKRGKGFIVFFALDDGTKTSRYFSSEDDAKAAVESGDLPPKKRRTPRVNGRFTRKAAGGLADVPDPTGDPDWAANILDSAIKQVVENPGDRQILTASRVLAQLVQARVKVTDISKIVARIRKLEASLDAEEIRNTKGVGSRTGGS